MVIVTIAVSTNTSYNDDENADGQHMIVMLMNRRKMMMMMMKRRRRIIIIIIIVIGSALRLVGPVSVHCDKMR